MPKQWGKTMIALPGPYPPSRRELTLAVDGFSGMPSSVIRKRFYDPGASRLTITFVTGRIYVYEDVPPDVIADFDAAFSKGQFFNAHIRDRYRCREVTPARD